MVEMALHVLLLGMLDGNLQGRLVMVVERDDAYCDLAAG